MKTTNEYDDDSQQKQLFRHLEQNNHDHIIFNYNGNKLFDDNETMDGTEHYFKNLFGSKSNIYGQAREQTENKIIDMLNDIIFQKPVSFSRGQISKPVSFQNRSSSSWFETGLKSHLFQICSFFETGPKHVSNYQGFTDLFKYNRQPFNRNHKDRDSFPRFSLS